MDQKMINLMENVYEITRFFYDMESGGLIEDYEILEKKDEFKYSCTSIYENIKEDIFMWAEEYEEFINSHPDDLACGYCDHLQSFVKDKILKKYGKQRYEKRNIFLEGYINKTNNEYDRYLKVKPIVHTNEDNVEQYFCPICSAFGNEHVIHKLVNRCILCGVKFDWMFLENIN